MSRGTEVSVVALDVGPAMHPYLDLASRALMDFVQSKMLGKPTHELALVYFGTTGTLNQLCEEMAAEGDEGQYLHITVQHQLEPPTMDVLRSLKDVPRGKGSSDFMDALAVGLDLLNRALEQRPALKLDKVSKRLVLVSNFLEQAKDDPEDEFVPALVGTMQEKGLQLDVISLDIAEDDAAHASSKNFNTALLGRICSEAPRCTERSVKSAAELAGVFKSREMGHTAYYSGALHIGTGMAIQVKVCKKSSRESFPSLGKQSPLVGPEGADGAGGADAEVMLQQESYRESEVDKDGAEPVPKEDRAKAYRYGQQLVPVGLEEEASLKYAPPRALQLLGVLTREEAPRHWYMKDTWCCVASKEDKECKSHTALAALAQALHEEGKLALLRFAPRVGSSVTLQVGTPVPATASYPAHLLFNQLPFMEDIRSYTFPGFQREDRRPTDEQMGVMRNFVDAMWLGEGPSEQLPPESTVNPTMHSFFHLMAERALNPGAQPPAKDPLVDRVLKPHPELLPGAPEALAAVVAAFRVGGRAGKGRDSAGRLSDIGLESPVEDFKEMVEQGDADAALSKMREAMGALIRSLDKPGNLDKALDCLGAFRGACVDLGRAATFNEYYQETHDVCRADQQLRGLWERVVQAGLRLIDSSEDPSSLVQPSEAGRLLVKEPSKGAEAQAAVPMQA